MAFNLTYSGKIQPEIKIRNIVLDFTPTYIWKRHFLFTCDIPLEYAYEHNKFISQKSKEVFTMNNLYFSPSFRFEKKNSIITCNLGIVFPTLNKISGDLEKERKVFGIEPGITISKVSDPILSNINLSFVYPIWVKEEEKVNLRSINIATDFYFLINEKFSYILGLNTIIGKESEKYAISTGIGYFPVPDKELRLSFSNIFSGFKNECAINLSFNMKGGVVKQ